SNKNNIKNVDTSDIIEISDNEGYPPLGGRDARGARHAMQMRKSKPKKKHDVTNMKTIELSDDEDVVSQISPVPRGVDMRTPKGAMIHAKKQPEVIEISDDEGSADQGRASRRA
ncbi:uncharacterized protein BXZ73DRAFT_81407, partial [Epithele typhae]|uniref:uncharacterized protein n=1 Tax=Epithele typhae TaxID=378194 RepID=UPI0020079CD5